jgi:hypothetical protein
MSVERSYAHVLPPPSSANGLGTPPCPDERCIATRRALRREVARLGAALADAERERDALRERKIRDAAEWADADVQALERGPERPTGIDPAHLAPMLRRALAELLPVGSSHTTADLLRRLYGGYGCTASVTTLIWRLRQALGGSDYVIRGAGGSGIYRLDRATPAEVARGYVPRPQAPHGRRITPERARAVLDHPDWSVQRLRDALRMGSEGIRAIRDGTHPVVRELEEAP